MNNDLVWKVVKRIAIVSLFLIGIMIFAFKEPKPIILGYAFGTTISILGFKLLHNTINKAVIMSPGKASGYSTVHYIARYIIYFLVLGISALADYLNFPATVLGLMMSKFVIIGSAVFDTEFQK